MVFIAGFRSHFRDTLDVLCVILRYSKYVAMAKTSQNRRGRIGRPRKAQALTGVIHVRVPVDMERALDDISASRLDRPSRTSIVREALADFVKRCRA